MNTLRRLHERLSKQRALIGLLQSQANPALAEMAGMCGYDFLLLDGEHGVFTGSDYLDTLRALATVDVLALVRLAQHDVHALGMYLDMGADGIVVPARTLARAMEYPPTGTRGVGASLHRVTRYGLDLSAHLKAPRDHVCLLVIIESALGVSNAEGILAVEGVDGVIIGPADLSADLGCAGDLSSPTFAQAVSHIEQAALTCGKLLGTAPYPSSPVDILVARGHRLLIVGADMSLIREAMVSQVTKAKSSL
jgi:2-keto-3-deoxy-L-rhamnonate aldolase RhmA